jgi:hypothetical protein
MKDMAVSQTRRGAGGFSRLALRGVWDVVCRRPDGSIRWREQVENLIVDAGVNHVLDVALSGGTQITTWYVGIKNSGAPAAGDTMASHGGWTENQNYDEATRPQWEQGEVAAKSISNSGNPATFTISADAQSIAGCFLTSNNTKGGSTGTLFSAVNFASAKAADDNDTLEVTYTVTGADDGV